MTGLVGLAMASQRNRSFTRQIDYSFQLLNRLGPRLNLDLHLKPVIIFRYSLVSGPHLTGEESTPQHPRFLLRTYPIYMEDIAQRAPRFVEFRDPPATV